MFIKRVSLKLSLFHFRLVVEYGIIFGYLAIIKDYKLVVTKALRFIFIGSKKKQFENGARQVVHCEINSSAIVEIKEKIKLQYTINSSKMTLVRLVNLCQFWSSILENHASTLFSRVKQNLHYLHSPLLQLK